MKKYSEYTLKEYYEALASDSHIPGGGGVSALCGVLSVALTSMVMRITYKSKEKKLIENPELKGTQDEVKKVLKSISAVATELFDAMDEDALEFDNLMQTFKLPKSSQLEVEYRNTALQEAYIAAARAPYKVLLNVKKLEGYMELLNSYSNKSLYSDVKIAQDLLKLAKAAAIENIEANIAYMDDCDEKRMYISAI